MTPKLVTFLMIFTLLCSFSEASTKQKEVSYSAEFEGSSEGLEVKVRVYATLKRQYIISLIGATLSVENQQNQPIHTNSIGDKLYFTTNKDATFELPLTYNKQDAGIINPGSTSWNTIKLEGETARSVFNALENKSMTFFFYYNADIKSKVMLIKTSQTQA